MSSPMICVFAHKRPAHLEKTLDALECNLQASKLPLTIYIDAAKDSLDKVAVANVLEVARKPRCFKRIEIVKRDVNLGLYKSITQGVSEALKTNESVIVLEDDIKTSPFFLKYMLDALDIYRDNKDVASIHGYTPPIASAMPETFFLRGADCWGWATWRDRWERFRHDAIAMADEIRQRGLVGEFNLNENYDYLAMLEARGAGLNNSWAICWHASCFLENRLTLYPGKSLVRNIGLDGSGEHCSPSKVMDSEASLKPVRVEKIPVEVNLAVYSNYCNHFSNTKQKFKFLRAIKRRFRFKFSAAAQHRKPSALALSGPYATYQEAALRSSGYNNKVILDKVYNAIVDVLEGRSTYERDGTAFPERPSIDNMRRLLIAHLKDADFVVDFGGGLGGTFINNRDLFSHSNHYTVVEQTTFAEAGQKLAIKYGLKMQFIENLCSLPRKPDILIFSSVLPYIPNAIQVLQKAADLMPPLILIDRSALGSHLDSKKWWIQSEPTYYDIPISYPIRPLSLETILGCLYKYSVVEQWKNTFDPDFPPHVGILLCLSA